MLCRLQGKLRLLRSANWQSASLAGLLSWILCFGGHSLSAVPPPQLSDYRLVFSDDFDTLDLGAFNTAAPSQAHNWNEGMWFSHDHTALDSFTVRNSVLSLTWKRGQKRPDSSISTFSTRNRSYCAWRYGYFEARMKWTPLKGSWPAFWLASVPPDVNCTKCQTGEVDIFEGQGSAPHTFFGTIHAWSGSQELANTSARNRFPLPSSTDFAQYHTYGLLWVRGRVSWYFDGLPLHSEPTYELPERQRYFMILGMQEGPDWQSGDLTGVTAQYLTLMVDWVRVWQTKQVADGST